MKTQKIITISLNSEEDIVLAVEEVLRMIREGNTSGYSPNFTINEEEEPEI